MTKQEKEWHKNRAEKRKAIRKLEQERDAAKDRLRRIEDLGKQLTDREIAFRQLADEENASRPMKYRQDIFFVSIAVIVTPGYNQIPVYLGTWTENLKDRIRDNEIDIDNLRAELEENEK